MVNNYRHSDRRWNQLGETSLGMCIRVFLETNNG